MHGGFGKTELSGNAVDYFAWDMHHTSTRRSWAAERAERSRLLATSPVDGRWPPHPWKSSIVFRSVDLITYECLLIPLRISFGRRDAQVSPDCLSTNSTSTCKNLVALQLANSRKTGEASQRNSCWTMRELKTDSGMSTGTPCP